MTQLTSRRRLHYGCIGVAVAVAALAAFGLGVLREQAGDYVLAFLLAGALAVAAGVASLSIKRYQRPPLLATA
jgi:hypothetical protein